MSAPDRTLVLGLGNPLLADDAAGLLVARALARFASVELVVSETSRAGLCLLDHLDGFDRAVLIDSIVTGTAAPGFIWRFGPDAVPGGLTLGTSHEVDLGTALRLGRELGYHLPPRIDLWAIEAADVLTIGGPLDARVRAALPVCATTIAATLGLTAEQRHHLGEQLQVGEVAALDC